jgi:phage tail sheath protein FI
MTPQYLSPGVYVEEVDKGAKPIEGVGTSVAAFIGLTQKGPVDDNGRPVNQPVFVANWTQFVNTFGGFVPGGYLAHAVYGYFNNGGGRCYVSRLIGADGAEASAGEIVARGALPSRAQPAIETFSIKALDPAVADNEITVEVAKPAGEDVPEDRFKLIVRRGSREEIFEDLTTKKGRAGRNVLEVVNKESQLVRIAEKASDLAPADRAPATGAYPLVRTGVALIPKDITIDTIIGDAAARTGVAGLEVADDVTMVCVPDLMALHQTETISGDGVRAVQEAMLTHCANLKDRVAILDCLPGQTPQQMKEWRTGEAGFDSKYGALYYPWIKVADPLRDGELVVVPPCGHMAGIYARTDTIRGVHKAPANEIVQGALALEQQITKSEQDSLNPIGVNCIRAFPGRGIRVWGGRTLSSDASWRYINVRRLFNFVEKSIEVGTQWVVFEPNDMDLWERIKRDVSSFLTRVWRDGALFGATPEEAFYVKCDEELNPPDVRDAGQVIIEVGLAPVKPAEFVIFRISQWAGSGAVAE